MPTYHLLDILQPDMMGDEIENSFADELSYWKNKCIDMEKKIDQHIKEVTSPSKEVSSEVEISLTLKEEVKCIKDNMMEMEKRWSNRFLSLSEQFAISDQYSRKNSLKIRGYKALPKLTGYNFIKATAEELNILIPSLNGSIKPTHIDDAHPLPTKADKDSGNKTVIVKFSNRWVKNEILMRRNELEGTGLTITEHLTPHTFQLLSAAQKIVGEDNTWVHNTVVFAQHNGIRYSIKTFNDLDLLQKKANTETPTLHKNPPSTPTTINNVSEGHKNMPTPAAMFENGSNNKYVNTVPNYQSNNYTNDYELNYPTLYNTLLFNANKSKTRTSTYTMRGRPSRNGRGGNFRRGRY